MGLPEIQLDIDELMSTVVTTNTKTLQDIDTVMQSSCNAVATLTISGWDGKAKDEFLEQFSTFKNEMRLFYENLSQFNDCLKQIYEEGECVYNEGAALLSSL